MTIDRYTRVLLTVIAAALVYLCVLLTPMTSLEAQTALRPGDSTGPGEVVVVGWRLPPNARIPVQISESVPLQISGQVKIADVVQTQERRDNLLRVAIAGWEEGGDARRPGNFETIRRTAAGVSPGLPVTQFDPR